MAGFTLVTARGSRLVRAAMPFAKVIQRMRGNRPRPARMTDGRPGRGTTRRTELPVEAEQVDSTIRSSTRRPTPPQPLSRRLRDPRTIISIVLPLALIVLVLAALPGFHLDQLIPLILNANPWLLLAAVGIYYLGFPLRGYRWTLLLRGAGTEVRVRDSTEIIFISWLVNCLVPAKLGDVYRAYLLRLNYAVSLSRTFGTVFIERVFDLFAIVLLGLAAGFWSFRSGMSPEVQLIFAVGLVVLVVFWRSACSSCATSGSRLIRRLPLPSARRRVLRPLRGGRLLDQRPPCATDCLRDRAHLGAPRRCACTWSCWRSASTSIWASVAPSLSPSSHRC